MNNEGCKKVDEGWDTATYPAPEEGENKENTYCGDGVFLSGMWLPCTVPVDQDRRHDGWNHNNQRHQVQWRNEPQPKITLPNHGPGVRSDVLINSDTR